MGARNSRAGVSMGLAAWFTMLTLGSAQLLPAGAPQTPSMQNAPTAAMIAPSSPTSPSDMTTPPAASLRTTPPAMPPTPGAAQFGSSGRPGMQFGAAQPTPLQSLGSTTTAAGLCDWREGNKDCDQEFQCVPLPTNVSSGLCVSPPAGGLALPLGLAKPVFYFPLVNGSLGSWPWGSRTARPMQGDQAAVPSATQFASVDGGDIIPGALLCPGGGYHLQIDNFMYGRAGPFAINLWAKVLPPVQPPATNNSGGNLFQYLLSHASAGAAPSLVPFAPNQVSLYLHAPGRPLSGVVRAMLKDSNDGGSAVYIDSDGVVGDNKRTAPGPGFTSNVTDGGWHMITLSTRADGARGYQLYVDGTMVAQLPVPTGVSEVNGGDPVFLTGPLVVCGRSDADPARGFQGAIAHLMVFELPLSSSDVRALYALVEGNPDVTGSSVTYIPPPAGTDPNEAEPQLRVNAPMLYDTTGLFWPTLPATLRLPGSPGTGGGTGMPSFIPGSPASLTGSPTTPATPRAPGAEYDAQEGDPCSLDLGTTRGPLTFCAQGLVCVPQRSWYPSGARVSPHYPDGVCSEPAIGVLLPERYPPAFPTPLAYFPLTSESAGGSDLDSWPDGTYTGTKTNTTFMFDTRFGSALLCNQAMGPSYVELDPVPYGATGGLAVNLWVRTTRAALNGTSFSYLFSQSGSNTTDVLSSTNQVHILIPQLRNIKYGISARAVLRDSMDTDMGGPSLVFLDSNGMIGNTMMAEVPEDGIHIDDGEWHMITLSTLPGREDMPWAPQPSSTAPVQLRNGTGPNDSSGGGAAPVQSRPAGFSLYVDGVLRGTLSQGAQRSTMDTNDTQVQITGGMPVIMDTPITLCGRADKDPQRGFTGALSNLMLFDVSLTPSQVAELYTSYSRQAIQYPLADVSSGGRTNNQTTVTGQPCVFPLSLGGRLYYECVYMAGVLSCPTQAGGAWAPCKNPDPGDIPDQDLDLSAFQVSDGTRIGPLAGGMPRVTTSGQVCVIPFTYQNNSYADCLNVNGTQLCMVPGGRLQECAPMIRRSLDIEASCLDPQTIRTPAKRFTQCVAVKGSTMCRTPSGTWLSCAPHDSRRVAVDGQPCQVPFTYAGLVRTDCVLDPTSILDREVCPTRAARIPTSSPLALGGSPAPVALPDVPLSEMTKCQSISSAPPVLQPRVPTRYTIDGQRCIAPGPGALSECLDYAKQGSLQCQTSLGALFECAPTQRTGWVTGASCAFPFLYRGVNRTDCVWADGVEGCLTRDGNWQECKAGSRTLLPLAPANTTARLTALGAPCVFPDIYASKQTWNCVGGLPDSGDPGYCRTISGNWQQCAPFTTGIKRYTETGEECILPFRSLRNVTYYDCMGIDPLTGSAGVCLARDGRYWPCAPRTRYAAGSGKACVFPTPWNGRSTSDCVVGPLPGGVPACRTNASDPQSWEPCDVLYATQGPADPQSASAPAALLPGTDQAMDTSRIVQAAPAGGDGGGEEQKKLALILGLVFGLGGGLLVLAIALIVGRQAWARRHRAMVMREMGMTGPAAQERAAGGATGGGVGDKHDKYDSSGPWSGKPFVATGNSSLTGTSSWIGGIAAGPTASETQALAGHALSLSKPPTVTGLLPWDAASPTTSSFSSPGAGTTGESTRMSIADRMQHFKIAAGIANLPLSPALSGAPSSAVPTPTRHTITPAATPSSYATPAAGPTGATASNYGTPASGPTGLSLPASTGPYAGDTGSGTVQQPTGSATGGRARVSPFLALSNELSRAAAAAGWSGVTEAGAAGSSPTPSPTNAQIPSPASAPVPASAQGPSPTRAPAPPPSLTSMDSAMSAGGASTPRRPAPPVPSGAPPAKTP